MVEKWLLQVQQTMIISLKDVMSNAVTAYDQDPRRKWVLDWPGQIIIAASTVYWTTDVTDAIKNGTLKVLAKSPHHDGIIYLFLCYFSQDYLEKSNGQIDEIVELVRGKLSKMARITLGALTVIDVHGTLV